MGFIKSTSKTLARFVVLAAATYLSLQGWDRYNGEVKQGLTKLIEKTAVKSILSEEAKQTLEDFLETAKKQGGEIYTPQKDQEKNREEELKKAGEERIRKAEEELRKTEEITKKRLEDIAREIKIEANKQMQEKVLHYARSDISPEETFRRYLSCFYEYTFDHDMLGGEMIETERILMDRTIREKIPVIRAYEDGVFKEQFFCPGKIVKLEETKGALRQIYIELRDRADRAESSLERKWNATTNMLAIKADSRNRMKYCRGQDLACQHNTARAVLREDIASLKIGDSEELMSRVCANGTIYPIKTMERIFELAGGYDPGHVKIFATKNYEHPCSLLLIEVNTDDKEWRILPITPFNFIYALERAKELTRY